MKESHEFEYVVRKTQEIAQEIGHTPLRVELESMGVSRWAVQTHGYVNIIAAAGLEPNPKTTTIRRPTNDIFRQDIRDVVEQHVPREMQQHSIKSKILVGGDIHFPFQHKPTIERFHEFNREFMPDYVIQMGDLYDMYAHSRFPKSQNIYKPEEEEILAREGAEDFWGQVCKDNPNAKKYQIMGNHDERPVKQTLSLQPTMEHVVKRHLKKLMTFDGVELIFDYREVLKIDGVGFHHGYLSQLGAHRDSFLENMVVAHTHKGGVSTRRIRNQVLFELNVGFMGDPESKAMSYTPTKQENYTLGFGYIDRFGPRFIF